MYKKNENIYTTIHGQDCIYNDSGNNEKEFIVIVLKRPRDRWESAENVRDTPDPRRKWKEAPAPMSRRPEIRSEEAVHSCRKGKSYMPY